MAQKPFTPTDELRDKVRKLAGNGLPIVMIGRLIGCDKNTLNKYFEHELHLGSAEATNKIAGKLFSKAMKGDTACLIFWLKCRANWSERAERNLGVIDGDPELESIPTAELERMLNSSRTAATKEGTGEPDSVH